MQYISVCKIGRILQSVLRYSNLLFCDPSLIPHKISILTTLLIINNLKNRLSNWNRRYLSEKELFTITNNTFHDNAFTSPNRKPRYNFKTRHDLVILKKIICVPSDIEYNRGENYSMTCFES